MGLATFVLIVISVSIAQARESCTIDANENLGSSIKLAAGRGKMPEILQKRDLAGACYEAGQIIGRVESVKAAMFPGCANYKKLKVWDAIEKCKANLISLEKVCVDTEGKAFSNDDRFASIKSFYSKALNCLDEAGNRALGITGTDTSTTSHTAK